MNTVIKKSNLPLVLLLVGTIKLLLVIFYVVSVLPLLNQLVAQSETVELSQSSMYMFIGGAGLSAAVELGIGIYFWRKQQLRPLDSQHKTIMISVVVVGVILFCLMYVNLVQSVMFLLYGLALQ